MRAKRCFWAISAFVAIFGALVVSWLWQTSRIHFIDAIARGDVAGARIALRLGADVEASQYFGWDGAYRGRSALAIAAERGDNEMLRLLLDFGANVERFDGYDRPPIYYAALSHNVSTVQVLIDAGANPSALESNGTALHAAAAANDIEMIDFLLKHNVSIDIVDEYGNTPLHAAVRAGKPEAVQRLLRLGADKDKRNVSHEKAIDIVLGYLQQRQQDYDFFCKRKNNWSDEEYHKNLKPYVVIRDLLAVVTVERK